MDYSYDDATMNDPFLSLDTNLDDISAVIQMDESFGLGSSNTSWHSQQPSSSYHNPYARPNQHSPPQEYYDPVKSREITSIVSLLQSDSPPHTDPYASMKFSPPNLDMGNCNLNGTARMLPSLQSHSYQPGTLAQQLAAPAMQPIQPVMSPPAMYVDSQMSPDYNEQKPTVFMPPKVKMESPPTSTAVSRKPSSTKEELLIMLMNMSPSEVDKLKNKTEPRSRPSAVATRVTKEHDGSRTAKKWEEEEEDDGEDMDDDEPPVRKGPKTERRTAHNLIEKKYRCSINDRIQHLKTMLAGEDAKLSKSATLRKAIDHIENLENENHSLRSEVDRLNSILKANRIDVPPRPQSPMSLSPTTSSSAMSPIASSPQSPSLPLRGAKRARMDQSRVTMFGLLFAMLIFNPLSFLASSASASSETTQRTVLPHGRVLETDESFGYSNSEWWQNNIIRPGFVWLINILVVVWVLTKLLVYGEPVQDFKSDSWSSFLSLRKRARIESESGNVREAMRQYIECLIILERPLSSPGFDMFLSVVWQVIRHGLNWLWIGRWFSRLRRDSEKPQTVVCKSHAYTALIYHKLHQLHLMGVDERNSPMSGLYLALSAVNLAESAGASTDGLPRNVMADIYIHAGLRTKLCIWAPFRRIVAGYFFRRARRHIRRADESSVNGLVWMYHPLAKKFLSDPQKVESILLGKDIRLSPYIFEDGASPISRVRAHFKLHLLSKLAGELTGRLDYEVDIVDVSRLLLSMSTGAGMPKKSNDWDVQTSIIDGDPMCTWWSHVLTCALYWKQSQNERAKKAYTVIRQCPKELLSNPLALAVGHAFCARKVCVDDRMNPKFGEFVYMHSRKALGILRPAMARSSPETSEIHDVLCRLAYEWIMTSLLDAWRQGLEVKIPYWTQKSALDYRTLYQEACNHYTFLDEHSTYQAGYRATVYQLTSRMLNGANPLHTWTAVTQIKRQRLAAISGHGFGLNRSNQPDPFHLHVLSKLHGDLAYLSEKAK